ncbi:diguanylate cyclase (GGDEF) domain-containing protein [Nakamurella panacisegetis]|uniref:Diguanylate cyclase (GGDEF) domain-containing protein n=1 Tax=Nakamurella panacisegetis TaxID=1090615 RepID=A0A1H0HNS3_9ACTN|nr:EAL domain-containing protein [Nakamurella panacisegetis]SDO20832.1 diguanylate cyclase (GGDEF) domain-containing protein [Nakamurella panacisegetis]
MTNPDEQRQWRSARHYLGLPDSLTGRLQPILTLAARTLGFRAAMINILDEHDQHSIAVLDGGHADVVPRSDSICDLVVRSSGPIVVSDARTDQRFAHRPALASGRWVSYAGFPLWGRESQPVGAICVVDDEVHVFPDDQLARLEQFGRVVEDQLDLIRRLREQRMGVTVATGELASALTAGQIVPWYQPIIELSNHRVVGFEALARWVHPDGTVSEPNSFIPLAEDSDLIIDMDLAVMRRALIDLKVWQQTDPTLRMSVNISSRHFDSEDWLASLLAVTLSAGVSPASVDLELTETARLSSRHGDGTFVRQMQACGFQVWLDDFGTGWSSLEYLLRLPADGLKIDRMLSLALGTPIGDALVRSVTDLTRRLGMRTTIEGLEAPAAVGRARELGALNAQGFFFSAAVPAAEIPALRSRLAQQRGLVDPIPNPLETANDDMHAPATDRTHPGATDRPVVDGLTTAVLDALPDATAVLNHEGVIVAVNRAWRTFSLDNGGSEETNGVGVSYLDVCRRAGEQGSGDARKVATGLRSVLAGALPEPELEYPCPSSTERKWFMLRITRLGGPLQGVVVSHVDITRRKMAEEQLQHAASHDPLTGLANRVLFHKRLAKSLTTGRAQETAWDVGLLHIDLDGFRAINDTFGHDVGDEVLRTVADRLRALARPGSTVARLGGDEFAILSPRATRADLTVLSRQVEMALMGAHHVAGRTLCAGGSIGVHLARAGDDAAVVLEHADRTMNQAKHLRRVAI